MFRNLHCTAAVIIAVSIATLGIVTGIAQAQPPRNPPPVRPGDRQAVRLRRSPAAGKFLDIPGLFPLSMTNVQREIGLTPDQKQQLKAVSDRFMAPRCSNLAGHSRGSTRKKSRSRARILADRAAQAAQAAQKKAETILTPQQLQAVKKIAFELSATGSLADPNYAEEDRTQPRAAAAPGRNSSSKAGGKDAEAPARNRRSRRCRSSTTTRPPPCEQQLEAQRNAAAAR